MSRGRVRIKTLGMEQTPTGLRIEDMIVSIEQIGMQIDFRRIFGNDRPVEVEIGPGKGGFLLQVARMHPERNFFGIEVAEKYVLYIADRLVRWGIRNVKLLRADARHIFVWRMPPECIDVLHVYHPDPWPKKRHHKRRLFQPDFVEAAVRSLKPGGRWNIQTDHAEYFEVIKHLTLARPELQPVPFEDPQHGITGPMLETNFAVRYGDQGKSIFSLAFVKKGAGTDDRQAPAENRHRQGI